ncbi:MAG: hypothetical protein AAF611_18180 [Bacteroidota bacterium]
MADVNTFDQGSKILQNVDVSSMVTALALGIAEAQERLDTNSVSQLIRLSESKVAGKSLLELGFQPAFYAFDFADISAKISLKMALKEEVEVDFSLSVDYKNNTTFDKDFFDQLKKSKNKSRSKYSKTQKDIALQAKTSEDISVNEKSFKVHKEEGSYSKIEKSEEEIRDAANELRVESVIEDKNELTQTTNANNIFIREEDGFIVIVEPKFNDKAEALLKMESSYDGNAKAINLNAKNTPDAFDKITSFEQTLRNAITSNDDGNAGTSESVVGINSAGIHRINGGNLEITPYTFYFDWDKHRMIDFTYSQGVNANSLTLADAELLAMALKEDDDLNITIKGYTDGSGSDSDANTQYNLELGRKRALSFKRELEKIAQKDFSDSRIQIVTEGEALANGSSSKDPIIRKVTVEFANNNPSDYLFFEGGDITTGASVPNASNLPNDEFVYKKAITAVPSPRPDITFTYGGNAVVFTEGSTTDLSSSSLSQNNSLLNEFFVEKFNGAYYLLHEEAKVNYFIHSKENKEVNVRVNNEASADMNKETTKVYVGETQNEFSKLKQSQKDFKGDRSLAISGSLDVRYARQFSMSVEGNASVSARMISVPPPTALENYIQTLTNTNSN